MGINAISYFENGIFFEISISFPRTALRSIFQGNSPPPNYGKIDTIKWNFCFSDYVPWWHQFRNFPIWTFGDFSSYAEHTHRREDEHVKRRGFSFSLSLSISRSLSKMTLAMFSISIAISIACKWIINCVWFTFIL